MATSSMLQSSINTTQPYHLPPRLSCSLKLFDLVLMIGYTGVLIIGTLGNGLVLYMYKKYWSKGPNIELLILYLAFFNFLSSIMDPFIFGYWILTCNNSWHFRRLGCKALPPLCRISTNISIGIILIMTIDRCRAIVSPLRSRFKRSSIHAFIALTIVLGLASELHYVNALQLNQKGQCVIKGYLKETKEYSYPLVILVTFRVFAIICISVCTTVAAFLKLHNSQLNSLLNSNPIQGNRLAERCRRVTKMLVVMATVFAVTVLPRDILHLVYTITWLTPGDGVILSENMKYTNKLFKLLQTSNAIYNVFIYAGMHEPFRKVMSQIFRKTKNISPFTRRKNHAIKSSNVINKHLGIKDMANITDNSPVPTDNGLSQNEQLL